MSAGRRYGLSAADSSAERVKMRCRAALGGALDRLGDGRRRSCGSAAAVALRPGGRLGERRAQAGDRLAVRAGALAQLLDLAQQVLAVRADGLELVEQRLVRREPLVGGLAARPGGELLGLLAALGQLRLGGRGARLGALELPARRSARALSSPRSVSAASRRRLAVSTWRRRSSTRARSRSACCSRAATDRRSSSASRTRASSGDDGTSACWRNFSHEPKTSTT